MSSLEKLKNDLKSQHGSLNSQIGNLQVPSLVVANSSAKLVRTPKTDFSSLRNEMKSDSDSITRNAELIKGEVAKKIIESRNNKLIEVLFVLDSSGSCADYVNYTINGYNDYIRNQVSMKRNQIVSTVLFDDNATVLEDRTDISKVSRLNYSADGNTKFYDTLYNSLSYTMKAQDTDSRKIDHTLVAIMADGEDNRSTDYDINHVRNIVRQCVKRGYEFIFLGAFRLESDLVDYASKLGIPADNVSLYLPEFTANNFKAVEVAIDSLEMNGSMSEEWKKYVKKPQNPTIESKDNNPVLRIGVRR